MFGIFGGQDHWPVLPLDEIKKRARLLVIDDEEFVYKGLFEKDGYIIDKWDDVTDLSKLEQSYFDLILLDVQGVGSKFSVDQGLGILNHIRQAAPAQLVIAFSNAEYSLKYQDFFKLADATLNKGADYVEFKRKVDELLAKRFSLGFYVGRISAALGGKVDDPEKLEKETRKAILRGRPESLRKYLIDKVTDPKMLEIATSVIEVGIKVISTWKS
jgi:CheY-like chemotaxis protein